MEKTEDGHKKINFYKKKMLGYCVYKQVYTEVEISDYAMHISQKLNRIFRKPREIKEYISLTDIDNISIQTKMDFWDTLYGAIFVIFGFFHPLWFLIAAVFFFSGYGKTIRIKKRDGGEFLIPTDAKPDDEVQQIMSFIKQG